MKNLQIHFAWAVAALALAAVASVVSRRATREEPPPADARGSAALRARIAELEG